MKHLHDWLKRVHVNSIMCNKAVAGDGKTQYSIVCLKQNKTRTRNSELDVDHYH